MFQGSIEIIPNGTSVDVLVMFCDLRGFTEATAHLLLDAEASAKVASHLYQHVVDYCSIKPLGTRGPSFKPAGDGLLVVWELPANLSDVKRQVNMMVSQIISMYDEFSLPVGLVPVPIQPGKLGVGVARGKAARLRICQAKSKGRPLEDYFGNPVNLASKLQNLARPSGVVLDEESLDPVLRNDIRAKLSHKSQDVTGVGPRDFFMHGASEGKTRISPRKSLRSPRKIGLRPREISDMFHHSHAYILAIRSQVLQSAKLHPNNGQLITDPQKVHQIMEIIVDLNNQELLPRQDIENNPSFLQIIPYPIFRCGRKVLTYSRGISGREERLKYEKSLGFGGHIAALDPVSCQARFCSVPSHAEEVLFQKVGVKGGAYRWRRIGIIWDDTTPANRVHLGIIYVLDVDSETDVKVLDNEVIVQPMWTPLAGLSAERFESWSQICLRSRALNK